MTRPALATYVSLAILATAAAQVAQEASGSPCPTAPNQFTCDSPVYAMTNLMAVYESCTIVAPGFDRRHSASYAKWLKLNATTLVRLRKDADAAKVHAEPVAQFRVEMARMTPAQRETQSSTCETVIPPGLLQNLDDEYRIQ